MEWEGGVGGGSGLGKRGGRGVSWVRGASTGVQATTSTVSPPMRQTRPQRVTVHRGGSSGEVMPLGMFGVIGLAVLSGLGCREAHPARTTAVARNLLQD